MKKLIAFVALAAAFALATNKASAGPFSISGMAVFNKTNYMKGTTKDTNYIATTMTMSLNNKLLYLLVSNAVANASNGSNGIAATLPSDGYIAYYPEGYDGKYYGYFYVTDKKDYFYQLSGIDANAKHYSFMELNTYDQWLGQLGSTNDDCCCCCSYPVPRIAFSANYSEKTGDGKYSATDIATLRIRSDPYWGQNIQQNELNLVGTFNPSLTLKDYILWSPSSATFTGSGGVYVGGGSDFKYGVIDSVSVKYSF